MPPVVFALNFLPSVPTEPAVQLGLTATPKRRDNADTYAYFGEPVCIYSLKEGKNDGFLTPLELKQVSTTIAERYDRIDVEEKRAALRKVVPLVVPSEELAVEEVDQT